MGFIVQNNERLQKSVEEFSRFFHSSTQDIYCEYVPTDKNVLQVSRNGQTLKIVCKTYPSFFRGLTLALSQENETFYWEEKVFCERLELYLDCSRNAIPTKESFQRRIALAAAMGYTGLYLYTEDNRWYIGFLTDGYADFTTAKTVTFNMWTQNGSTSTPLKAYWVSADGTVTEIYNASMAAWTLTTVTFTVPAGGTLVGGRLEFVTSSVASYDLSVGNITIA